MSVLENIDRQAARIGEISTAGYFLALRIKGQAPMLAFRTYPQSWTDTYMERGYLLRDPITTWALTIGGSIRWSSRLLPDPFGVFKEAANHGLNYGASVAHGPMKSMSICSFAHKDREFTDTEIAEVKKIVIALHDIVELPKQLTDQQKELFEALSRDDAAAAVAKRLGLSDRVAKTRIRELCDLFFAETPAIALTRARDSKLI